MKRDMDLIRELLLRLESIEMRPGTVRIFSAAELHALSDRPPDEIKYHFALLEEAGLITANGFRSGRGDLAFSRITWEGHDFLDAVRDPTIWEETKGVTAGAGGFTLDLLKDLAKGFIKTQIKNRTWH